MRELIQNIHFVGIGGSGMSGIADVLIELEFNVTGSDIGSGATIDHLKKQGAKIFNTHAAENVCDADVVVVSSAVDETNPEIIAAREARIPVVPRAEMLGELLRFRKGIAVAGTHGKTTCTSLTASIMIEDDQDPTFVVGGLVRSVRRNSRLGKGDYIVVEADESDASFLHLQPQIAVVTNIDADHMGTYGNDFERLKKTFLDFIHNLPFYGHAVLCADDAELMSIFDSITKPVVLYGLDERADVRAINVRHDNGHMCFDVVSDRLDAPLPIRLGLPGVHNVQNALAAITVGLIVGTKPTSIQSALQNFEGIGRRFQRLGQRSVASGKVMIVDDYAHHPREIKATLEAAAGSWPDKRIIVVFQPHRYSRTRDLLPDFASVLQSVAVLAVAPVYAASETPADGENAATLCKAIHAHGGVEPVLMQSIEELGDVIDRLAEDGDVVLCLGAGDISRHAHAVVDEAIEEVRDAG